MRNIKIVFAMSFLFSVNAFSQMGQMGQMGNNRMTPNNQQPIPNNPERDKEEMEKARKENLEKLMSRLTVDLNLDALQQVAIKQIYDDNMKKQGIIMKKEITEESKIALLKSLNESTEIKIIELFNKEQKC
jgi:hypothetical protein